MSNAFVTPENDKGDMLRKYISQISLFSFGLILNLGIIGNWGNINHDYLEAWDVRLLGWDYMMMMMV